MNFRPGQWQQIFLKFVQSSFGRADQIDAQLHSKKHAAIVYKL